MKTILVPTDFSAHAENALHFAIILAAQQRSKILLLSVYRPVFEVAPVPFELHQSEKELLKKETLRKLRNEALKIEHAGGISYDILAEEGEITDTILDLISKRDVSLVVMGTRGENDIPDLVFGTNTNEVIEKAPCPVLAIPAGVPFSKPINRITYATDYLRSDLEALKVVASMADAMSAHITVLHVADEEGEAAEEAGKMSRFIQELEKENSYTQVSFEVLMGENIDDRLLEYIKQGKTDMLVLSTRFRNYFGRLLGHSIAKTISATASVPVMAFHHRKETAVKLI